MVWICLAVGVILDIVFACILFRELSNFSSLGFLGKLFKAASQVYVIPVLASIALGSNHIFATLLGIILAFPLIVLYCYLKMRPEEESGFNWLVLLSGGSVAVLAILVLVLFVALLRLLSVFTHDPLFQNYFPTLSTLSLMVIPYK
jgi:hypothetical protein